MTDITVIGLGAMGSAIARTLLNNNCALTVWNRSPARMEDLLAQGASGAASLADAVSASPQIVICIDGYAALRDLMDQVEIAPLMRGKTVIQMSTGTPAETREAQQWITALGARYLDCSIMVYPETVGTEKGQLLVSGDETAYQDCSRFIGHLGGDVRYLGTTIGAAAALDLALLSRLVATTIGVVHGIHVCESEGVSLQDFADMFPPGDRARSLAATIQNDDFDNNIAVTVNTAIGVVSSIKRQASDLGINSELPDFALNLYQRASAAGFQDQESASLIKILRSTPG